MPPFPEVDIDVDRWWKVLQAHRTTALHWPDFPTLLPVSGLLIKMEALQKPSNPCVPTVERKWCHLNSEFYKTERSHSSQTSHTDVLSPKSLFKTSPFLPSQIISKLCREFPPDFNRASCFCCDRSQRQAMPERRAGWQRHQITSPWGVLRAVSQLASSQISILKMSQVWKKAVRFGAAAICSALVSNCREEAWDLLSRPGKAMLPAPPRQNSDLSMCLGSSRCKWTQGCLLSLNPHLRW